MSNLVETDRIKGIFGPLVIYKNITQHGALYLGPKEYLESALFQDCLLFRAQHRVGKVISHTVFTAGFVHRLFVGSEIPQALSAFRVEDANLSKIVVIGERAVNWEYEKLRNVTQVSEYRPVSLQFLAEEERELSTCFLIQGVEQVLFDTPREINLIEVRIRYYTADPDYDVRYFNIPHGLVSQFT